MKKEELYSLAKQAGFVAVDDRILEKFVKLIAAKERKACADLIESMTKDIHGYDKYGYSDAIRGRDNV